MRLSSLVACVPALVLASAFAGCSDSGTVASPSHHPSTVDRAVLPTGTVTPYPMRPPWQCPPSYNLGDVERIAESGEAVALVGVRISGPANMTNAYPETTALDGVSDSTVLAGSLPAGPIRAIRETTGGGSNQPLLTPGHYLLFVGRLDGDQDGVYYSAAGPSGSFRYLDADTVTPMCAGLAGYPGNGSSTPMRVATQSLSGLASQALAWVQGLGPSSSSSGSTNTANPGPTSPSSS